MNPSGGVTDAWRRQGTADAVVGRQAAARCASASWSRRGSFATVCALSAAIERFTREWNASATPFTWVKTADEILAKAVRKPQDHSGADTS